MSMNFINDLKKEKIEIKANEDGSFGGNGGAGKLMPKDLEQQFIIKNIEIKEANKFYDFDVIEAKLKCISEGEFKGEEYSVKFKVHDVDPKVSNKAKTRIVEFATAANAQGFTEDTTSDQSVKHYLNSHLKMQKLNMIADVWDMEGSQGNWFPKFKPLEDVKPAEEQETKAVEPPKSVATEQPKDDSIPF